jgi:hypothetical protein
MRSLSLAVNLRRSGRSRSSGDSAAGAETVGGLRPARGFTPEEKGRFLSEMRGMTVVRLTYVLKGKLPARVCLTIIGTEGLAEAIL